MYVCVMGQVEDAKWRQRWQNMLRSMREAKGSDHAVAFSPTHIVEASSTSQKHVSPNNLWSTTLYASSPSHSRSQMFSDSPSHSRSRIFNDGAIAHANGASVTSTTGACGAEHWYGGIRNAQKAETPFSFGKRDAQIGATKCQEEAPEQEKTREREERARVRQQLQFEIERERERTKLRESAVESRKEGALEWERVHERLAASFEDGTKVLWAGKERESGGMAGGDQFGEVDGQSHSWNAAGMPSILRKFELEQVMSVSMKGKKDVSFVLIERASHPCCVQESFRKDMEALKLILGGRE